jgi:hypothetical protein
MPTNYIKSLVAKGKGTEAELEAKWDEAKAAAKKEGHEEDFDYVTAIFKKMIHENLTRCDIFSLLREKSNKEYTQLIITVNDEESQLQKMIEFIKKNSDPGHSFEAIVDPEDSEANQKFFFDGDGAFHIIEIEIKEPGK